MSSLRKLFLSASVVAAIAVGGNAFAQDPAATSTKRTPNVMLLVDSSGSMEHIAGDSVAYPVCGTATDTKSRWINVIEVLTGNIQNYSCEKVDRTSASFKSTYTLGGVLPIDADYRNPYVRAMSAGCGPAPAPSALTSNAFDWVPPVYATSGGASCSTFTQDSSGLIDGLSGLVRFGLMTFDTLPNAKTGFSSTAPVYQDGIDGAWSYYVGTAPSTGHPVLCANPQDVEVGVRNAAAPSWEGKMIPFGDPAASDTDNKNRHDKIKKVLLATRPYGATPIAGALYDAQQFLWTDNNLDPAGGPLYFAPEGGSNPNTEGDYYVKNGCRDEYIVLLTDGEPNLDLRPECEAVDPSGVNNGVCPFYKPEDIAHELATGAGAAGHGSGAKVKTYVVGFAKDAYGASSTDCRTLDSTAFNSGGICANSAALSADPALKVCCQLQAIAIQGGTSTAYFAADAATLKTQLATIFSAIAKVGSASATQPVLSPYVRSTAAGGFDPSGAVAYRMLTSYSVVSGQMWRGNVERLRFTCDSSNVPVPQTKDASKGDDFATNINKNPSVRRILSFSATPDVTSQIHSERSIRPNVPSTLVDGLGVVGGSEVSGTPSTFVSNLPSAAIRSDLTSGACNGLASADLCKNLVMNWTLGITTSAPTRCTSSSDPNCSLLGDVIHSTPVIVDHPTSLPSDSSYESFMTTNNTRPMMVYTSSNDGFLHGFQLSPYTKADADTYSTNDANNERFAFIPPAVLPYVQKQYPSNPSKLLDGVPVVLDVPAEPDSTNNYYPYLLQRSGSSARNDASSPAMAWRTILVQSFGEREGGYFAVDITDPVVPTSFDKTKGPRMLWQLTTDANGNRLFGQGGGTPIITSIYLSSVGKEVAVAVLPGGYGGAPTGRCARSFSGSYDSIASDFVPRTKVRCYPYDKANDGGSAGQGDDLTYVGARSLTIVRLDSGEIIKTFRRNTTEFPSIPSSYVTTAFLDSPITGIPAAYPAGTGAVADRIFVGDQDGTLWRVDVSGSPDQWKMELFFDAFSKHPDKASADLAADAGRPIVTRPMLSVDTAGQITVAFSTGDQSVSGTAGEEQYVWSLLEQRNQSTATTPFSTVVKWWKELTDGEHVLGPLQLFGQILYFSTILPTSGSSNPCDTLGQSRIWGLHYLTPLVGGTDGSGGAKGLAFVDTSGVQQLVQATDPAAGVIFGVSLEVAPTCRPVDSVDTGAFIGGNRNVLGSLSSPQMQLVYQTTNSGKASPVSGFTTQFGQLAISQPQSASTIDSWAAILD